MSSHAHGWRLCIISISHHFEEEGEKVEHSPYSNSAWKPVFGRLGGGGKHFGTHSGTQEEELCGIHRVEENSGMAGRLIKAIRLTNASFDRHF